MNLSKRSIERLSTAVQRVENTTINELSPKRQPSRTVQKTSFVCRNVGTVDIPENGVAEIINLTKEGNLYLYTVRRPTADSLNQVVVVPSGCVVGDKASCFTPTDAGRRHLVLFNGSFPSIGETCGCVSGEFYFDSTKSGFIFLGGSGGLAVVRPFRAASAQAYDEVFYLQDADSITILDDTFTGTSKSCYNTAYSDYYNFVYEYTVLNSSLPFIPFVLLTHKRRFTSGWQALISSPGNPIGDLDFWFNLSLEFSSSNPLITDTIETIPVDMASVRLLDVERCVLNIPYRNERSSLNFSFPDTVPEGFIFDRFRLKTDSILSWIALSSISVTSNFVFHHMNNPYQSTMSLSFSSNYVSRS